MAQDDVTPDVNIEPIHFVDGHEPPMLLVQGLKDKTVDPENATRLTARITEAGGHVKCIRYPKVDHPGVVLSLAFPFRWIAPVLDDVTAYFHEH